MRRTTIGLLVALVAVAPIAACNLTVSLDGLTGGVPDGGTEIIYVVPDATTSDAAPMVDATVVDAADAGDQDADAADATPIEDATSDAGIDAPIDSAIPPFCPNQSGYTLCSDFDEGNLDYAFGDAGGQWGNVAYTGGMLGLNTGIANAPSPPGALQTVIDLADGGTSGGSFLVYNVPLTASAVRVTGKMLLSHASVLASGGANGWSITQVDKNLDYSGASFNWDTQGISFQSDFYRPDAGFTSAVSRSLPFSAEGVWQSFDCTVTFKPTGHIRFLFDGLSYYDADVTTVSTADTGITVQIGIVANGKIPPSGIAYDDVTVTVTN